MSQTCDHSGWGEMGYEGETGPCPPPAEMVSISGGVECPICKYHVVSFSGDDAETYMAQVRGAPLQGPEVVLK
mgnify:CR=1 FL=1